MMKRILFYSMVAVSIALTLYWVKGSEKDDLKQASLAKDTENMKELEQKMLSFNIDGRTSKGAKQWHLEGKTAEMFDNEIHFDDLEAVAYGEEGAVNLKADRGIYSKDRGEVVLIGNVRVVSSDGSVLTTEKAKWSQNTREIFSDFPICIERENMIATGTGGAANSAKKTAMLKKDVTVEIKPDTKVTSDGSLVISQDESTAVFYDNVKVKDKDGKLFADKLTVHLDKETQKIAKVVA